MLRPYQQAAVDAAIAHMQRSVMPGVLELATGAGKSHIVAALAGWVWEAHKKRVLCLQPSKELTEQNHAKFLAAGAKASIFSASAGSKCLRHPVVYGTPGTVKNSITLFSDQFGAIIIDESHGVTPTIRDIVDYVKSCNPRVRVIGMTATPYRMGTGYIYAHGIDGGHVGDEMTRNPYFHLLLYQITTRDLIEQGYLTNAHADPEHAGGYDTQELRLNSRGQFDARQVEQVFEGRGRLTSQIVADVVARCADRMGVMIFAATVAHAKEIMESLPRDRARMLGGNINMSKGDRERLITDFKLMRYKYIVSIGTLTTGFDAPHVDAIAVLRKTESPGLFQQIIGRGLRLHPDKKDCLVLDYAGNVDFHNLRDDLFTPAIKATKGGGSGEIDAACPQCGFGNRFAVRHDIDGEIDKHGYLLNDDGTVATKTITTTDGETEIPMPAHYGRRCCGQVKSLTEAGVWERCSYRWQGKECQECGHENDIAARYCERCKAEIIDPNEKLQMEFAKVKSDPYQLQTDRVLSFIFSSTISKAGNECLKVDIVTEYRSFSVWVCPLKSTARGWQKWTMFCRAVCGGKAYETCQDVIENCYTTPETVTYQKQKDSSFFEIFSFSMPADVPPPGKNSQK